MYTNYQTPVQPTKSYPWCNYNGYSYNSSDNSNYSSDSCTSYSSNDSFRDSPVQYGTTEGTSSTPYSAYYYQGYSNSPYYSQYYSSDHSSYNQSYNYQWDSSNVVPYVQDQSFETSQSPKAAEFKEQVTVVVVAKKSVHQNFDEKVLPLLESKNAKKRLRHDFTPEQKEFLLSYFRQSIYPCKEVLEEIADKLNTTTLVIQTWFKNTRSKQKKLANNRRI